MNRAGILGRTGRRRNRSVRSVVSAAGAAVLALLAAACATTTHDSGSAEPAWRRAGVPIPAPGVEAAGRAPIAVYVAAFGLAPGVAAEHPELAEAQVGLGLGNRIADALYESGRFRFLEEKAEMAERIADLLARRSAGAEAPAEGTAPAEPPATPAEARWLLYGEVVSVEVERRESVAGLVGKSEVETRVGVQIRLLDRESRRYVPATASGTDVARGGGRERDPGALDPAAVAAATGEAVKKAAAALVEKLDAP